jgi:mycothiol synthase
LADPNAGRSTTVDEPAKAIDWAIRPYRDGDLPGIAALMNAVNEAYSLNEWVSEGDLRSNFERPRSDPERQVVIVVGPRIEGVPDHMPIGSGRVMYEDDEAGRERLYFLRISVHPAAEGKGLESVLAARLVEIVRDYEVGPKLEPREKVKVKAWSREELRPLRTLWGEIGLREVRQFWVMERDLTQPIDRPQAVEGIIVRTYNRPDDDEAANDAFNDSFSDHWDHHPQPLSDWAHRIGNPYTKPELSWLAEVEGEAGKLAGFCICGIYVEENENLGVQEGWIELLGTTRDWRRKGLGRALLLHGLDSLRSADMDTALLGVDSESLTGANRLYESVGFRVRNRGFAYECLLDEVKVEARWQAQLNG